MNGDDSIIYKSKLPYWQYIFLLGIICLSASSQKLTVTQLSFGALILFIYSAYTTSILSVYRSNITINYPLNPFHKERTFYIGDINKMIFDTGGPEFRMIRIETKQKCHIFPIHLGKSQRKKLVSALCSVGIDAYEIPSW